MRSIVIAAFAALAFALLAALAVLPAQDAAAHVTGCRGEEHRPEADRNSPCYSKAGVEFADWCINNFGLNAVQHGSTIFCKIPSISENRTDNVCTQNGYRVAFTINCEHNNVSPCALNNPNAEYDVIGSPHSCKCAPTFVGNISNGCVCPEGKILTGGRCASCAEGTFFIEGSCGTCDEGLFYRKDQTCGQQCQAGNVTMGKECVTPEDKCKAAIGWKRPVVADFCNFVTPNGILDAATGMGHSSCYFRGLYTHFVRCQDAFGDNLDFPPSVDGDRLVFNCDEDGTRGLSPRTVNTTGALECACQAPNAIHYGRQDGVGKCCPAGQILRKNNTCERSRDLAYDDALEAEWCRHFGGSPTGRICIGADTAKTFCIMDSALGGAFACGGFLRHVRRCREDFERPALNPFLCGAK